MRKIFVFGSNLKGIHGKGAALSAKEHWQAEQGIGKGPTGFAYAIPTKATPYKSLPLKTIKTHVADFLDYARAKPDSTFLVTAIGTGLAGYKHEEIAPLFRDAPANCWLPAQWNPILNRPQPIDTTVSFRVAGSRKFHNPVINNDLNFDD